MFTKEVSVRSKVGNGGLRISFRPASWWRPTPMNPDPIALRVARRHQADVLFRDVPVPKYRVEYSNAGTISAVALARMLEPTLGVIVKLRFRPSLTGSPNTVSWEALGENANVVSGKLVLHAAGAPDEVVSWAEVTVNLAT
jgi:hypothetical protein